MPKQIAIQGLCVPLSKVDRWDWNRACRGFFPLCLPKTRFRNATDGNTPAVIRIGCSGWSYQHWRGVFYPQSGSSSRWLELYAQEFDTVEINATFYRLPAVKTVEGWARRTPDDFLFAVKASRYLTHVKRLREIVEGVKRMDACVEPLRRASKLGPMLWQLPPRFHRDDDLLGSALEALTPGRHASSSATRAGSPRTCTSCFDNTVPRWWWPTVRPARPHRGWTPQTGATCGSTRDGLATATTARGSSARGQGT